MKRNITTQWLNNLGSTQNRIKYESGLSKISFYVNGKMTNVLIHEDEC